MGCGPSCKASGIWKGLWGVHGAAGAAGCPPRGWSSGVGGRRPEGLGAGLALQVLSARGGQHRGLSSLPPPPNEGMRGSAQGPGMGSHTEQGCQFQEVPR